MYDDIKLLSKTYLHDFGAASEVSQFRLPPGYKGRLLNVGVSITETFVGTTTDADVQVGTTADPDAYAKLVIPETTAADLDFWDVSDDTDAIILAEPLPADTLIKVTFTAPTGGTPAGIGWVQLDFEIWK